MPLNKETKPSLISDQIKAVFTKTEKNQELNIYLSWFILFWHSIDLFQEVFHLSKHLWNFSLEI